MSCSAVKLPKKKREVENGGFPSSRFLARLESEISYKCAIRAPPSGCCLTSAEDGIKNTAYGQSFFLLNSPWNELVADAVFKAEEILDFLSGH